MSISLLERPAAQVLLNDAQLHPATVRGCQERLTPFLQRYLPHFYRIEQREHARVVIEGKLSGLERKTSEPIARRAGENRKPIQVFVGAGAWDDEAVMGELRVHVGEEIGDAEGILIVDGSAFVKKGTASCGVKRQWCGRLGKVENCQVGVFLAYATVHGHAPLDRQLFLPEDWANDAARRAKCHVPDTVVFEEKWRIAQRLIERSGADVPHRWVVADDEFGRVSTWRAWLRQRRKLYVLDVPSNTLVRDLSVRSINGARPKFETAQAWAARQPARRWQTVTIRDGEKGPLRVQALDALVQTRDDDGCAGPVERLLVTRTLDAKPDQAYALSNAKHVPLQKVVRVGSERHRIEEVFQEGKGEVGLGHYEVRSWVGWHHHMTLTVLAQWFLVREQRRIGGKNTGHHDPTGATDFHETASEPAPAPGTDRRGNQSSVAAHGGGPHLSLLPSHDAISAPPKCHNRRPQKG
jgi:SRSO17 transposase